MENINDSAMDIRKTMNEIKSRLDESLVFNKMVNPKKEEDEILKDDQNTEREVSRNVNSDFFDIKPRLKQIRKLAITTMAELDPSECPDDYKTFKSILDMCDKSFAKSNEKHSKE